MKIGETLLDAIHIVFRRPKVMLPALILTMLYLLLMILSHLSVGDWRIVVYEIIIAVVNISVVSPLVIGMYPSIVRNVVDRRNVSLIDAFLRSYHKFWSMFGAFALVSLIIFFVISIIVTFVLIPLISFGIRGVIIRRAILLVIIFIISVLFYYIPPAIVLDDLKAVSGFYRSVSKGKSNFLSTLVIMVIPSIIFLLVTNLSALSISTDIDLCHIPIFIIYIFLATIVLSWIMIVQSYAYISIEKSYVDINL